MRKFLDKLKNEHSDWLDKDENIRYFLCCLEEVQDAEIFSKVLDIEYDPYADTGWDNFVQIYLDYDKDDTYANGYLMIDYYNNGVDSGFVLSTDRFGDNPEKDIWASWAEIKEILLGAKDISCIKP